MHASYPCAGMYQLTALMLPIGKSLSHGPFLSSRKCDSHKTQEQVLSRALNVQQKHSLALLI